VHCKTAVPNIAQKKNNDWLMDRIKIRKKEKKFSRPSSQISTNNHRDIYIVAKYILYLIKTNFNNEK